MIRGLKSLQDLPGDPLRSLSSGPASFAEKDDMNTLWLCQNSYWKWPFIVDFPIENGDFP